MASLPSFVELMSSLGLDKQAPSPEHSSSSPASSPPLSPTSPTTPASTSRHVRARSAPSATEHTGSFRLRGARFSPYLASDPYNRQPGSSATSPTDPEFNKSTRAFSTSPRLSSSFRRQRIDTSVSVCTYDSSTDLSANTPISSYVRRKTPPESPSPKSFVCEASPSASPMPFSLPTLPPLFSLSTTSLPFTSSLSTDTDIQVSPPQTTYCPESFECSPIRRSYHYGVRISALRSTDLASYHRRRHVAPIA